MLYTIWHSDGSQFLQQTMLESLVSELITAISLQSQHGTSILTFKNPCAGAISKWRPNIHT